jgi:large conductance mechanosensitive channel
MKKKITPITEQQLSYLEKGEDKLENEIEERIVKFYTGWKQFAFKKDIINVAIGMIIGASFKHVVNSLVTDIIMPIIIGLGSGTSAENLFIVLVPGKNNNSTYNTLEEAKNSGAVTINYGSFITIFLDLIFISLFLYIIMRCIRRMKREVKQELLG